MAEKLHYWSQKAMDSNFNSTTVWHRQSAWSGSQRLIFTQNSIENMTAFLKIQSDNSYLQFIEQNLIHERQ